MKDSESVKEFHSRVTTIVNQKRALGEDLKEPKVVEKVLRILNLKFDFIVKTIEEVKDLTKLIVNQLIGLY